MPQNPKITFLTHGQPTSSGDFLHRIGWPAQALAEHTAVEVVQMTHPEVFSIVAQAEVLVICMVVDGALLRLVERRHQVGLPTVYEISDDFCAFPPQSLGALGPF